MCLKTVAEDSEIETIIFAAEDLSIAECAMQVPCYVLLDIALVNNVFASV